jgi:hypothetical protein
MKVKDPIYRTMLEVLIIPDDDDVDRYLNKYDYRGEKMHSDSQANTYRLRYSNSSSNYTLIRLRVKSIPQLVHELIHHAMITFMDKGIHISEEEDEVLCYHVEYYLQEVLKQWDKPKKGKK